MAAKIDSAASQGTTRPTRLTFTSREKLFDVPAGVRNLSARPDGEGFFAIGPATSEEPDDPAVIHVMLNAHERLKEIAPVPEE